MEIINIISIIAIIIAPIASVIIAQRLQDKAMKRKDKMDLFKTLMMTRTGWSIESARALNILDIVFSDDKAVREAWRIYYDRLCVDDPNNPSQTELNKIQEAQYSLLEAMAESLGYKDKITWKTIQKPYKPVGMSDAERNQQIYQQGQMAVMQMALNMMQGAKPAESANAISEEKHE